MAVICMKRFIHSIVAAMFVIFLCSWSTPDPIDQWEEFSHSKDKLLFIDWLKQNARSISLKKSELNPVPVQIPSLYSNTGVFITLIKNRRVRGCYGAFDHSETDASLLLRGYLKGALSYDPRYRPLERDEIDEAEIVVTVASRPEQVESLNNVDISRFGLFIECDGEQGIVFVPAEYKTSGRLNRENKYSSCRTSRFRAVTIREE